MLVLIMQLGFGLDMIYRLTVILREKHLKQLTKPLITVILIQ